MNLPTKAKREAKGSLSTYLLERSERLRDLGQPTTSSGARGLEVLVNLPPGAKREAKESLSTYHFEQSERFRGIGEPSISSDARVQVEKSHLF